MKQVIGSLGACCHQGGRLEPSADSILSTHSPCRYDPLPSPEAEAKLLQIIHEMYAANVLPGCLELVTQDLVSCISYAGTPVMLHSL
jgi:hypothetical protein